MRKINSKFILFTLIILIFTSVFYTRFVNLGWGLPYSMHPDERNMAAAVQRLHCELPNKFQIPNLEFLNECLNPHFFAYGQFPLYVVFFGIKIVHFFTSQLGRQMTLDEAILGLRTLSALISLINVLALYKLYKLFCKEHNFKILDYVVVLLFIYSPALIQFSHFGTTESLLMLSYTLIIYFCILFIQNKPSVFKYLIQASFFSGLALATKLSSVFFIILPIIVTIFAFINQLINLSRQKHYFIKAIFYLFIYVFLTLTVFVFLSPHNIINYKELLNSMDYELAVATGSVLVFYTRQFVNTLPILFQFFNVFPYSLGWPVFILFFLGFLLLPWKKEINILRLAFLIYFFSQVFLFSKWIRFMAPIFPLMILFAALFIKHMNLKKTISVFIVLICIIPGIAYLSIYQNEDVRFKASEWIYKNIPNNSYVLSETANVVDIPVQITKKNSIIDFQYPNYKVISFNFYDLDQEPILLDDLKANLQKADYILVPSRRIYANYTCENNFKLPILNFNSISNDKCLMLNKMYPVLNEYYRRLFSGKLGFKQVAKFTSYPKIELFGKVLIEFPDEQAEETWTVFDHPVIRIYKRNN